MRRSVPLYIKDVDVSKKIRPEEARRRREENRDDGRKNETSERGRGE